MFVSLLWCVIDYMTMTNVVQTRKFDFTSPPLALIALLLIQYTPMS